MAFLGPKAALLPAIIAASFLAASAAFAEPPPDPALAALQSITYHSHGYSVQMVDPKKDDLRIFYADDAGKPLHDFPALVDYLKSKNAKLLFAANAGMFEVDWRPVGLLLQNGSETAPLNLKDGQGNFYMKPNGVFEVNEKQEAHIVESSEFAALATPPVWATQSGPLMVQGGNLNPDFNADSKNLNYRSGVGIRKDGKVFFAISSEPVNFYNFAELFLNKLACPNALYLDGTISAFWTPGSKAQPIHRFGPIIGITEGLR